MEIHLYVAHSALCASETGATIRYKENFTDAYAKHCSTTYNTIYTLCSSCKNLLPHYDLIVLNRTQI